MARRKKTLVDKYKTMVWFDAVALRSGCSATDLERQFSPATMRRSQDGRMRGSGIFSKYQSGELSPTITLGARCKKSLLFKIEMELPGTTWWLFHPIWAFLGKNYVHLDEVQDQMLLFERKIVKEFFVGPATFMRRRYRDAEIEADVLLSIGTFDALAALIGLVWEAALIGDVERLKIMKAKLKGFTEVAKKTLETRRVATKLGRLVENRVADMSVYRFSSYKVRLEIHPYDFWSV